jgi:hypothetical protein
MQWSLLSEQVKYILKMFFFCIFCFVAQDPTVIRGLALPSIKFCSAPFIIDEKLLIICKWLETDGWQILNSYWETMGILSIRNVNFGLYHHLRPEVM